MKRRYRRFRYYNQARNPRLLVIIDMLKLPLQLLAVALPLWIAVGIFNAQPSFESQRQHSGSDAGSADASARVSITPVAIDRKTAAAVLEEDRNGQLIVLSKRLNPASTVLEQEASEGVEPLAEQNVDPVIKPEIKAPTVAELAPEPAPDLVQEKANVLVNAVPESIVEELSDADQAEPVLPAIDKADQVSAVMQQLGGPAEIHNDAKDVQPAKVAATINSADWLAGQVETSFVIQLRSADDYELMEKRARRLSTEEDLAVYPYAVTDGGDVIYGLSYGLFETLSDAKAANSALPAELVKYGTWIRQVGAIKRQMQSIEPELQLKGW